MNFLMASRPVSPSASLTVSPPLTALMAASRSLRVTPAPVRMREASMSAAVRASRNISVEMNWSPRCMASFSVRLRARTRSRPICTSPCVPETLGRRSTAASASWRTRLALPPERSIRLAAPPSGSFITASSRCTGSMNWLSCARASDWASPSASWNLVVSLSCLMCFSFLFGRSVFVPAIGTMWGSAGAFSRQKRSKLFQHFPLARGACVRKSTCAGHKMIDSFSNLQNKSGQSRVTARGRAALTKGRSIAPP